MDQRLAVLSTQLEVDELRAKCRAEAVVHVDQQFAQLCGAIHQASVQRMQELIALPASGDGRGLLPQHERTEEEKKILAIEAGRETTSKAKESLDRMVAAAATSLEASRKELAEREGMLQETSERLQKADAMLGSLKARQDEVLGQVAAAEGKAAARGKDLESLRQELRVQEEAAGCLDRAVREEKEKIELERKRVQKLGATLKDLGTKGQGR